MGPAFPGIPSPGEAARLGIRVVHQEAPLVDTMSVTECVALFRGYPTGAMRHVRWRELERRVVALFGRLGIDLDPRTLAGRLTPAERALVHLAIALDDIERGNRLLILDEATASLPDEEARSFLARVKALAATGLAVLMVTHRIREIPAFADEVTVLANGRVVHRGPAASVDEEFIISKMVGGAQAATSDEAAASTARIDALWAASGRAAEMPVQGSVALEVADLRGGTVHEATFTLGSGEVLGITGLASSGVVDLPYLLSGALRREAGSIRIRGQVLPVTADPSEAIRAGIVLVPSDRLRQGGVRSLSMRDNIILPDARRYWRRGRLERAVIDAAIAEFDIQPPRQATLFERLSGGNQQKVVLSKWLLLQPSVLILDDPTSGVDPASRRLVFDAVQAAAQRGIGVDPAQ